MEFIYSLKCQKDKFYIGQTYNVQIEYNEHLDGTFCDITKEFKPFDIDAIFEVSSTIPIELVISKYINKYGSKNIYFLDNINKTMIKDYKKNKQLCICEKPHFLSECQLNLKDKFWSNILNKVVTNLTSNFKKSGICYKCGRYGHEVDECFARTHIEGHDINSSEDECDFC